MSDCGPDYLLRTFRPDDQEAVLKLVLDGLGDHFRVIDPTLNPDLVNIEQSYLDKGYEFIVAERQNQIIGAGALIRVDDTHGRIVRVSVSGECRRQGIGRAIVLRLIQLAKQRNYEALVVETNHDWLKAIALYRDCGFVPYDRDEVSIHMQLDLVSD